MKNFKFSMVMFAFIAAVAASAFTFPEGKGIQGRAGERWFAFVGSNENAPGDYYDLGENYNPNTGCVPGAELCAILVEAAGGDPILPDQTALSNLQSDINAAKMDEAHGAGGRVYVKGE